MDVILGLPPWWSIRKRGFSTNWVMNSNRPLPAFWWHCGRLGCFRDGQCEGRYLGPLAGSLAHPFISLLLQCPEVQPDILTPATATHFLLPRQLLPSPAESSSLISPYQCLVFAILRDWLLVSMYVCMSVCLRWSGSESEIGGKWKVFRNFKPFQRSCFPYLWKCKKKKKKCFAHYNAVFTMLFDMLYLI